MSATQDVSEWQGLKAVDCDGKSVGEIESAYGDWILLKAGFLGRKRYLVPAGGAAAEGDAVRLKWSKDHITDGPEADGDGILAEGDQDLLEQHYDLGAAPGGGESPQAQAPPQAAEPQAAEPQAAEPQAAQRGAPASEPDAAAANADTPVTYDEEAEIRDPEKGTRRDAGEMKLPEHHKGIRPHPDSDDSGKAGIPGTLSGDDEKRDDGAMSG